jgi:predicted RNase H-like HicB family nuclease
MPGYYVYRLDGDGHVQGRTTIFCKDDEEARERAKALIDGHIVELWEEGRRIAIFTPKK